MKKIKKTKNLVFLLLIFLLSCFSWRSLTYPGYFSMHDDMQFIRIYEMDKCFKDGQIPCRWVPDLGYGYGYPLFNYYPPFPYFLGELFHLLGFSILYSVKIVFGLSLIFSGVFMYFLAKEFWGEWGGLLAAIFYIYAPYRAVDVYVRGALAESWGLVWFPLVFLAIYKIIINEKKAFFWVWLLAASLGFLFLSHNIMSLIFSPFALIWALFWLGLEKKPKKIIPLILGGIWGFFISAFFILPALWEKKFAHTETMLMGYFNYLAHFADLRQLFLNTKWGWGASVWGPEDGMPFMIGFFHWGGVVVNFLLSLFFWFRKEKKKFWLTMFLTGTFLLTVFMTHSRSTPIWMKIKILEYLQFPWRFLAPLAFFSSFLGGALISFLKNCQLQKIFALVLIGGTIVLYGSYFRPEKFYFDEKDNDRLSGEKWEESLKNAIFDYLPIYASYPPGEKAPSLPQFISGGGEIGDFQKGTNWQKMKVTINSSQATIRLSLYDFPGWKVYVDGKETEIDHNNFLGLITFKVNEGTHEIVAKLTDTLPRKIGNSLSLVGFSLLVGGSLKFLKRK